MQINFDVFKNIVLNTSDHMKFSLNILIHFIHYSLILHILYIFKYLNLYKIKGLGEIYTLQDQYMQLNIHI